MTIRKRARRQRVPCFLVSTLVRETRAGPYRCFTFGLQATHGARRRHVQPVVTVVLTGEVCADMARLLRD